MHHPDPFQAIALSCQNSRVGKLLPTAFYVHRCALPALDPLLQNYERRAREIVILTKTNRVYQSPLEETGGELEQSSQTPLANINKKDLGQIEGATLVKFSIDRAKVSYLFYPDFDCDPHPELQASVIVDLAKRSVSYRDYSVSDNPPILHRKETFVPSDYPFYEEFAQLTRFEEALGLLENSRFIGTRQEWQTRLKESAIAFVGHRLVCSLQASKKTVRIDRHKAAIVRKALSRPVRLALEANLFPPSTTFFDYGCGYGGDVQRVAEQGYSSSGWDPYYRPDVPRTAADVVNLGYIINVVEDAAERREALIKAWSLTRQVLIVAAQVLIDDRRRGLVAYEDGMITRRNTFQKYYEQEELKIYIDQVLNVDAVPAGLGIYFVFRDQVQAQSFRASRFRSRATTPRVRTQIKRFEDYKELLSPLMAFVTERGRLPIKGELSQEAEIKAEFGTLRRAFEVILQVSDPEAWDAIAQKRRQDLKLYLALSKFSGRPTPRKLPVPIREDIKALFGDYRQAYLLADLMLFSLGDLGNVADVCKVSPVGKRLKNALLVHISALQTLEPLLRLYEGCASRTIGRLEDANLIKFHLRQPKISYLFYPNFDTDPHPLLHTSMEIDLRNLQVNYWQCDRHDNPPVLHEKEALVRADYPLYEKFAKLTRQETDWGLLDDFGAISRRRGWLQCLEDKCAQFQGHQLRWRKDADPYKLKLLRSQINARKKRCGASA